jgi:ring-1,2-phenylacetyl-CoA epoxidase subunit PaaA
VPQAEFLGLRVPDPDLTWDEATAHYRFGTIDWTEFQQILQGNGPCNRERVAARQCAHEGGRWVREAALAHAEKRCQRAAQAA